VKVCDFGIARLQQAGQARVTTQSTMGTSEYMAPAQASGGPVDGRTDLYGLGCVLYAMLTGGPPFSGENPMGVMWQQVHRPPASVASLRAGVPAELDALVGRLLAKDPADRPAGAGDVRDQLARLAGPSSGFVGASRDGSVTQPLAAAPMHGRASVPMRTRTMPVLDAAGEDLPTGSGFRLGPGGITAVAIGVAVVTAVLVALFMALRSEPQAGGPGTSPAGPTSAGSGPSVAATKPVAEAVDDVRTAIQAQVAAGELNANSAKDLTKKLDEIERQLNGRESDKAAEKVDDLRDRLAELRRDGKVSNAGYAAILASIDQLASAVP
jgi:serine/threonine-protein kinase